MLFLVTHENTVNQSYCLLPGQLFYVLVTFIEQNFLWGGGELLEKVAQKREIRLRGAEASPRKKHVPRPGFGIGNV